MATQLADRAAKLLGVTNEEIAGGMLRDEGASPEEAAAAIEAGKALLRGVPERFEARYWDRKNQHFQVFGASLQELANELKTAGYDGPQVRALNMRGVTVGWVRAGWFEASR